MALIKCPECGKEVSSRAEVCIHCGYPLSEIYNENKQEVFQILNLRINEYNSKKNQWVVCGESNITDIKEGDSIDFLDANDNVIETYDIDTVSVINENTFLLIFKNVNDIRLNSAKAIIKSGNKLNHAIRMSVPTLTRPSHIIEEKQVKCPKCGSTQIQIVPRKWTLSTGFLTNKVDRVCMNCKHKF